MKAVWNNTTIAESDETIVVEGNHYFPFNSIVPDVLEESAKTSVCPWKGDANYYNIVVDGETNKDGAWTYHDPKDEAKEIKDYVAFWNGIEVIE